MNWARAVQYRRRYRLMRFPARSTGAATCLLDRLPVLTDVQARTRSARTRSIKTLAGGDSVRPRLVMKP